jgi:hypothetical protein
MEILWNVNQTFGQFPQRWFGRGVQKDKRSRRREARLLERVDKSRQS